MPVTPPNVKPELMPGDALLYGPSSFFGWLIAVKTWTKISHVEIYEGGSISAASRDGLGVNRYSTRWMGLAAVRRPVTAVPLDLASASRWFDTVRGQKYDWLGLLCFTLAVRQGSADRQFCSEFATRWYRKAGWEPFNPAVDADHVAPSEFWQSSAFETIWRDRTYEVKA